MLRLILAGIRSIGDVHATNDIVMKNSSEKCYAPLGTVEAHNIDRFSLLHPDFMKTLGECSALFPVLLPGPSVLDEACFGWPLYPQSRRFRPLILRIFQHRWNRPWSQKLRDSTGAHADWQLN